MRPIELAVFKLITLAYQQQAPSREAADRLLDSRLNAPFTADANDFL